MITRSETEGPGEKLLKRQVETFYQVNRFISSIDNLPELLNLIMQEAATAVAAEASCIALYDAAQQNLRIEFASGAKTEGVRHLTLPLGQGILGQVALTLMPLRVDDVSQDARFDPSVDRKTGFHTRCILAVPLLRRRTLLGVLEVINKQGEPCFTDEDTRLLEVVATQAAIAIDNARLFERSLQAERFSVVGRMAASIVHDLKSPMTVIRGMAELMTLEGMSEARRRRSCEMILAEVSRLTDMTQELLDYSRGNLQLKPQAVAIGPWLREAVAPLAEQFTGRGLTLMLELGYAGLAVFDPARLRRVVVNLVSNAGDALAPGGRCAVATRREGDWWELTVQDTGKGIPSEARGRLFEPFFTYGKERGTGLGLAIVREIVTGHGGTVECVSKVAGENGDPTAGTTFRLRLPVGNGQV